MLGCVQLNGPAGDAGVDAKADGGADAAAPGDTSDAAANQGCTTEPQTSLVLCSQLGRCPGVIIDRDAFPNCGFRGLNGIDPVCVCNGYVCSLGSAATCAEAQQLIVNQTELQICTQVSEGRCTLPNGANPPPASGNGTCTRECMQQCGNTPGCPSLCGCPQ